MAKKEIGFNQAVKQIEEILKNIEEGEPDIDRLSDNIRKAAELIKICRQRLRETEEKIDGIINDLKS
ncbi:MAG: exodeoxyribonuclease VII small subunit [Bacteroidales bacterium]|jgi:exodeoxyribonuclease VII small subunit|nr:exodeoxyribonuclease VII small subunit [Bacteroidales bacterium]MDT8374641.1 exodeoxyribonuclease VII small subunit [Bacteroidales bacterium]